jgi:hypothetical protein
MNTDSPQPLIGEHFCDIDTFIKGISQEDPWWVSSRAISDALNGLICCIDNGVFTPISLAGQINEVFQAVADHAPSGIFANFCKNFHDELEDKPLYRELIIPWLERLLVIDLHPRLTKDEIIAAQIFFGVYDSSWQQVGDFLLAKIDSPNPNLRACAAYQISRFVDDLYCCWKEPDNDEEIAEDISSSDCFCGSWPLKKMTYEDYQERIQGVPPLLEMVAFINAKEIEHPGVACAWKAPLVNDDSYDSVAGDWLLEILGKSRPEACTAYFPMTLGFHAHEQYSGDLAAIRYLLDRGRVDIACAAATDENEKIDGLESLLVEIGNDEDSEIVRQASWHLAYHYHYLHPKGSEEGYVELINQLSEIDVFLLISDPPETESPYAVVIYPKKKNGRLDKKLATQWVDLIFPESMRGEVQQETPYMSQHYQQIGMVWYKSGYVHYQKSQQHIDDDSESLIPSTDLDVIDQVTIGYRSNIYWNPRQFLELG